VVIVDDVEVRGLRNPAELHVENAFVFVVPRLWGKVPVCEEEGDQQQHVEENVEDEPPLNELHWPNSEEDAFPFGFFLLVL
jgi:hypothetical protein